MGIDAVVTAQARARGAAPALVDERGTTWTFAELEATVERLAAWVVDSTRPGDRVGVVADNEALYVALGYAVPRAGRILTLLNQRLDDEAVGELVTRAGCAAVVTDGRPGAHGGGTTSWLTMDDLGERLRSSPSVHQLRPAAPDDVAWLLFTSGTTGPPKAVPVTHRNLRAAVAAAHRGRAVRPDDVYLYPFPLCHIAAYNVLVQHAAGVPVVLAGRFDADRTGELVGRHGVTTVSLAPTMISRLVDLADRSAVHPLAAVRQVGYGAAALPFGVLRRLLDGWNGDVVGGYGMTELSGNIAFLGADAHRAMLEHPDRRGVTGRIDPGVRVRILGEDGGDVPAGDEGEIVVRGDQVVDGYWHDPAATAEAFSDGWFRTGDIGRIDASGLLSVVDRRKDLVITGGENVSSREVEEVVAGHPAVAEAAVVGLPDDEWGEVVTAVVVPVGDAPAASELEAWCRARLAGFKTPRRMEVVDALPTNASGKVLKRQLRDRFGRPAAH